MAWYNNLFGGKQEKAAPIAYNSINDVPMQALFGNESLPATISDQQALRLSAVYACCKVLSETVSSLPVYLYRQQGEGKELHTSNPLFDLVCKKPNEFQTGNEFMSYVMMSLLLKGNFYGYVNRTGSGRIIEILPLPHDSVSVMQDENYNIVYKVTHSDKSEYVYTQYEILHIKGMSLDGIVGLSPLQYNASVMQNAIAARDYAGSVFANDATPRGVLSTDGILSDEAYDNIRQSWEASHGGIKNAHRIAILEQGLKFSPMQLTPADVQLLESRKYSRTEIASIYRVPPHMLADLDRATFSNIEHQDLAFYKSTILPYLTNIEARLNCTLLNVGTQYFKFNTDNLLRTDLTTRVNAYKAMIETGIMSPNEAREKLDMNPREGGDDFIIGSNNLNFGNEEETNNNEQ